MDVFYNPGINNVCEFQNVCCHVATKKEISVRKDIRNLAQDSFMKMKLDGCTAEDPRERRLGVLRNWLVPRQQRRRRWQPKGS